MNITIKPLEEEKKFKPFAVVLEFRTEEDIERYINDTNDLFDDSISLVKYDKINKLPIYTNCVNQITQAVKRGAGEL